jgi:CheY-like chemotaxis protein
MLQVSDTGTGMTPEVQAHIFEPFYTTKEQGKGTGLGLATVYGVIKQSGGYILLHSEVGKGARFDVYLPRAEGVAEVAPPSEAPIKRVQGSTTILLVEDESSLRKLTGNTLKEAGYKVLEAGEAFQAMELAKEFDGTIDLLLTDVVMPGLSGRELAEKLRPERPEMRVLYISGYTDGAVATHGVLESGITILRKPFTRAQLLRNVEEILAKKQNERIPEQNAEYAESGKQQRPA